MPPMSGPPTLAALPDLSNTEPLLFWLGVAAGFLLGSVPFAYLLGRLRGIDLRQVGSGNVGATNLARSAGLALGIVGFLLDAAKGAVPALGSRWAGGDAGAQALASGAAVLGHCYSPFLAFRGGKGVATMAGAVAVLSPWTCALLLGVWGIAMAALRTVGIASSITAVAALAIGVRLLLPGDPAGNAALAVVLIGLSAVVLVRHRSNLRRYFAKPAEEPR